jgi:hypothetical protein
MTDIFLIWLAAGRAKLFYDLTGLAKSQRPARRRLPRRPDGDIDAAPTP